MMFIDGGAYHGDWIENLKEGKGVEEKEDGSKY